MKFLRWIVVVKNNPSGFYQPVTLGRFLVGFADVPNTPYLVPKWADADPSLYKLRGARFIVSELRRVGFNVSAVPYLVLLIVDWFKARKKRKW